MEMIRKPLYLDLRQNMAELFASMQQMVKEKDTREGNEYGNRHQRRCRAARNRRREKVGA